MSVKWIKAVTFFAALFILVAPAGAFAATAPSHTATTFTTGQVVSQLTGQVRGVELGSTGATITLEVNGKREPIRVGFGALAKSVEGGEGGGLLALAAIPMAGGTLIKILNFLSKLGRG